MRQLKMAAIQILLYDILWTTTLQSVFGTRWKEGTFSELPGRGIRH